MPLFSIVMAVYNNERYLPVAIESILSQDYKNFELIIVDDGSTDKTSEIVDNIARKDNRVHAIHQTNQWIYASLNNGIEVAKGDYVYVVNSDDCLRPGGLRRMAESIRKYHPDVIWTKILTHKCDENQNIIIYDYFQQDQKVEKEIFCKNKEEVRAHWLFFYKSDLAQNQINLYKREIMCSHRFRNDVYGGDVLYNISIASEVNSAVVLKDAVYAHYHYLSDDMNASVGKYYGYEHDMFNEIYLGYMKLFASWSQLDDEAKSFLGKRRLTHVTREISALNYGNCELKIEEKIKKIFEHMIDDVVYQCAVDLNCTEELEARILSGIRVLLAREELSTESEMYFVYEMLESLLRYEKEEDDFIKIKRAVFHPLNIHHIGISFYQKLNGDRKEWT